MQLIVKTPLYKFTSYCAHLVEHCVLSGYQSEERFFDFTVPYSDAETKVGRTIFWLGNEADISRLIQEIQKPLDKMSIFREKKLLNQELDCDKEWVEFLSERVGKLLYKEKRIPTWKAIQLTQQEVVKYHQTCYQEKNMRIVDDRKNNIIIQRPSEIKTLTIPNGNVREKQYSLHYFGKEYKVFVRDYSTLENYVLFYFLDWFYDFIASYEYRYKGISYFFPTGSLNFYPNNLAFFRQKSFVVQNSFFDKTRELFLSLDYKINEIALLYEMYKSEIVLAQEVRNIIQKVSKKQIDYYFLG